MNDLLVIINWILPHLNRCIVIIIGNAKVHKTVGILEQIKVQTFDYTYN